MSGLERGRPTEVSVVIPTFNRWPYLSRAVASALGQEDVALEVLVVDDGSTDGTSTNLARLDDPRVRVFRQSNSGVARARNRGVDEARAPWVAFLDDDDYWAPRRLREHLDAADAANASWAYGTILLVDQKPSVRYELPAPSLDELDLGLLQLNIVGSPSAVSAKTELIRSVGGFDEELSVLADWDLWIRLHDRARAARCPLPLVSCELHRDNMSLDTSSGVANEVAYLVEKHRSRTTSVGVQLGGEPVHRWMAENHRRAGRRFRAARDYVRIGIRYGVPLDVGKGLALVVGERMLTWLVRLAKPEPRCSPEWLEHAHFGQAPLRLGPGPG